MLCFYQTLLLALSNYRKGEKSGKIFSLAMFYSFHIFPLPFGTECGNLRAQRDFNFPEKTSVFPAPLGLVPKALR
jgi:hypothetical protein